MEVIFLLILGIVQGLCEFLPVSSSGHLVLLSKIFKIEDSLFVSIILHVATLLAIVVVFWKDIKNLIRHPFSKEAMNIYIATIPTCIIVMVLMPLINESFEGNFLFVSFLVSAGLLFFVERYSKRKKSGDFSYKNALAMGIAQGLAVFPGVSRSGTTISAGLLSGGDKKECAKFSFLMSIPIIILSMILEIVKIFIKGESVKVNVLGLSLSFIFAFIIGILSIKIMLKLTERTKFKWFSLYLIAIAVLTLIVVN